VGWFITLTVIISVLLRDFYLTLLIITTVIVLSAFSLSFNKFIIGFVQTNTSASIFTTNWYSI